MEDSDDLKDISGPQCWYGIEQRKSLSTWWSCDDQREKALTHNAWKEGRTDIAVGLHSGISNIHNATTLCSTWSHDPVFATIRDEEGQSKKKTKKKPRMSWRPLVEEAKAEFKMKRRLEKDINLEETQKQIEVAAQQQAFPHES